MELTVDELKIIEKALQSFVLAKKNAIVQAESMTETVAYAKDLEKTAALLDKIQSVTYRWRTMTKKALRKKQRRKRNKQKGGDE